MKNLKLFLAFLIFISCGKEEENIINEIQYFQVTILSSEGGSVSTNGGSYIEGTELTITASPNDNYMFSGWSNGSNSNPLTITISSDIEITANFEYYCEYASASLDLSQSSYDLFDIIWPMSPSGAYNTEMIYWLGENWEYGFGGAYIDYNDDGIRDIVGYRNNYDNLIDMPDDYTGYERKQPIRFFLGDCEGNFTPDPINDNLYLGLVHGRKFLFGDFNNDNHPDFFLIGHGYDREPFGGEYLKSLISDGNGGFIEFEYTDLVSFYHGGATGDYDNDGDLDVLVVEAGRGQSAIYENNNGMLTANLELIDQSLMPSMFNAELYDFNNDGYLDIICGGHDWQWNSTEYDTTPLIIYGDGGSYVGNESIRLPETGIYGQGVVTDFNFFDLDDDGMEEIIITRTGDMLPDTSNFYQGWSIQIIKQNGGNFIDMTNSFIENYSSEDGGWIKWGHFKDYDGDGKVELYNTELPNSANYLEWELNQGFLYRVY